MRNIWIRLAVALLFVSAGAMRANAYVDRAPTLARVIRDAQAIVVVEVAKFNRENGGVILNKTRDIKGQTTATQYKHQLALGAVVPQYVLEWTEPGQKAILFVSGNTTLVCIGRCWYEVHTSGDGWWRLAPERNDLPMAYSGTVTRLTDALDAIVAGKSAPITVVPHAINGQGASFDVALNRASLPGLVRLERLRGSLQMGDMVMSVGNNSGNVLGPGMVGENELPALIEKLRSAEATVRAETADDLRTLGPKAKPAQEALVALLTDENVAVRMSAAAALLQIDTRDEKALGVIRDGLNGKQASDRRRAASAAGLAGVPAGALAARLGALLADDDELVRNAALLAIATIGPPAAGAFDDVVKLLDNPASAAGAADALGRIGSAARPAMKRLAQLLTSKDELTRWAAVRGMAQIGGEDSGPVIDYLIARLQAGFTEWDGYNMVLYLSLLGPTAQKSIPTLQRIRVMPPGIQLYARWTIDPEQQYPWGGDGFGGGGPGGPGGPRGDRMGRGGPGGDFGPPGGPGGMRGDRGPGGRGDRGPPPDGFGPGGPGGPRGDRMGRGGPGGDFGMGPGGPRGDRGMGPGGPGGPGGGGGGGRGGGPGPGALPDRLVFESFLSELGTRLAPNAKVLAKRIVAGTAGSVPNYGYDLLLVGSDAAVPVFADALKDAESANRQRAISAISWMGRIAAAARPALEAAKANADASEIQLLDACLAKIGPAPTGSQ